MLRYINMYSFARGPLCGAWAAQRALRAVMLPISGKGISTTKCSQMCRACLSVVVKVGGKEEGDAEKPLPHIREFNFQGCKRLNSALLVAHNWYAEPKTKDSGHRVALLMMLRADN